MWPAKNIRIKVDNLCRSVDTGISPARTNHPNLLIGHTRERRFQFSLNRAFTRLPLPAREAGTIVFNANSYSPSHTQNLVRKPLPIALPHSTN